MHLGDFCLFGFVFEPAWTPDVASAGLKPFLSGGPPTSASHSSTSHLYFLKSHFPWTDNTDFSHVGTSGIVHSRAYAAFHLQSSISEVLRF